MIESRREPGDSIPILVRGPKTTSRREHVAEIGSQSFVHPKEIVLYRLLIIECGQIGGTTVFPVPRVDVLVRKEARIKPAQVIIHQAAFFDTAVIGFVMLESEMSYMI